MLRLITVLAFTTALLVLAGGCKKTPKGLSEPPGEVVATLNGAPEKESSEAKEKKALDKSGISEEEHASYVAEFEKQSPKYGFELSEDKEYLRTKGSSEPGIPILAAITETAHLQDAPAETAGKVRLYLEHLQQRSKETQQAEAEKAKGLERIDRGEIMPGLAPAADPAGDWQSIGETREGEKHFLVEHDGNYYKTISVNKKDEVLHIQEIKDGKVERDVSLPYKYNAEQGQLTTTSAGGGPGDSYVVMELPDYPDRLFVRPLYDTVWAYTVYRRQGLNPNAAPPEVRASSGPGEVPKSDK
jgi:hypothetical protein